jgi:hypothetical protein
MGTEPRVVVLLRGLIGVLIVDFIDYLRGLLVAVFGREMSFQHFRVEAHDARHCMYHRTRITVRVYVLAELHESVKEIGNE